MQLSQFDLATSLQTPYIFLTGKGGVGKTSISCALAVALADQGKEVLLVSTDPASNLQDVFEVELSNQPQAVPNVNHLFACNLNPEEAAREYREQVVGPYRGLLPDSAIDQMEEQLSGACTVEIAAFDEFTRILTTEEVKGRYDHIIFDTAPTGHTLRLLQLPSAWDGFLEESTHGASCLGPLSGLVDKKALYSSAVQTLSNQDQTLLLLVARPEFSSLFEAERAARELKEIGIENQNLVVNGVKESYILTDQTSKAFYDRQQKALKKIPEMFRGLSPFQLPFVPYALTGIDSLRRFINDRQELEVDNTINKRHDIKIPRLSELVDDMVLTDKRIIFTMGKGGVGKTTVAAAIAIGLVEKGKRVHLTTTDPAAHLDYVFGSEQENDRLSISRIDPKQEVESYRQETLDRASDSLDEEGIAYLQEDLNSPCTEEIAVFRAFSSIIAKADDEVVVIDTAPTGHTLLLLDAAQSYHKELERASGEVPESVKSLLPRLSNDQETEVVIVSLAEATPVLEAKRLQDDLNRALISPKWWVLNQSLYATPTSDSILLGRAQAEMKWIQKVQDDYAKKCAIIPWQPDEKLGYQNIKDYL